MRAIAVRNDTATLKKPASSLRVVGRELIHGLIIKKYFSLFHGNKVYTGKVRRIARTSVFLGRMLVSSNYSNLVF